MPHTTKKSDANRLEEITETGKAQLLRYLSSPELAQHEDMVGYLLVCVGWEVRVVEKVERVSV